MELENRLKGRSADKNTDAKCHSYSVSERSSRERCDSDSGTRRSKKREMQDSHSSEDEGLRDAEIEEFLHSRSVFLSKHLFAQRQKKMKEEIGPRLFVAACVESYTFTCLLGVKTPMCLV